MKSLGRMTFVDRRHVMIRLLEMTMGTLFLTFIVLAVPLKESGYMAIPAIIIPCVIILDGLIRYLVLKQGITLDPFEDKLEYPKSYSRGHIKLSAITSESISKTYHSGAQHGTATYTYDIHLHGNFGHTTLVFATKKARDQLLESIKNILSTSQRSQPSLKMEN